MQMYTYTYMCVYVGGNNGTVEYVSCLVAKFGFFARRNTVQSAKNARSRCVSYLVAKFNRTDTFSYT